MQIYLNTFVGMLKKSPLPNSVALRRQKKNTILNKQNEENLRVSTHTLHARTHKRTHIVLFIVYVISF